MGVLINFQHDTANEAIVASTRYDRCPKVFLSAIALAATVIFWL